MSWTKTSERGYLIATETIEYSGDPDYSAIIDWLPAGADFIVMATADALSADAALDVYVGAASDGTFISLKPSLTTGLNDNTRSALYDVSAYGEAPYYKIAVNWGGTETGKSVTLYVISRKG